MTKQWEDWMYSGDGVAEGRRCGKNSISQIGCRMDHWHIQGDQQGNSAKCAEEEGI
jgi:hypothetical protein